jgi:fumarylacetoacetase
MSGYAKHFSSANIPFGVASDHAHPGLQCVSRIGDTVVFLAALAKQGFFDSIDEPLEAIFLNVRILLPCEAATSI